MVRVAGRGNDHPKHDQEDDDGQQERECDGEKNQPYQCQYAHNQQRGSSKSQHYHHQREQCRSDPNQHTGTTDQVPYQPHEVRIHCCLFILRMSSVFRADRTRWGQEAAPKRGGIWLLPLTYLGRKIFQGRLGKGVESETGAALCPCFPFAALILTPPTPTSTFRSERAYADLKPQGNGKLEFRRF